MSDRRHAGSCRGGERRDYSYRGRDDGHQLESHGGGHNRKSRDESYADVRRLHSYHDGPAPWEHIGSNASERSDPSQADYVHAQGFRDRGRDAAKDTHGSRESRLPFETSGDAHRSARVDVPAHSVDPKRDDVEARKAAWRAKKAAMGLDRGKSVSAKSMFSAPDDPSGLAPVHDPKVKDIARDFARKTAEIADQEVKYTKALAEEEDALDAFMSAEVMPEVHAKQQEVRKRELDEKKALFESIKAGKDPAAACVIEDEEPEATPDLEIQVPKHKVKLIVGPGGERIKSIQRKSRTRIQVKKEAAELDRAFGTGPQVRLPGKVAAIVRDYNGGEAEMATIMIYGEGHRVEVAKNMLLEAVENREQKQKQRQKEYDKKKEEKRRNRQIYLMRHARDYEMLEVPVGTPKSELKAAYRKLALKWHPDRHPSNPEEAKAKFQEISKAYELLMSTDEEVAVKAIQGKG